MSKQLTILFWATFVFLIIMIPQSLICKYILHIKFNEALLHGVAFISFYVSHEIIVPKIYKKG